MTKHILMIAMLLLPILAVGQDAVITGPDGGTGANTAEVGEMIVLDRSSSDGNGFWDVESCNPGSEYMQRYVCGTRIILVAKLPGKYEIELTVFKDDNGDRAEHMITIVPSTVTPPDNPDNGGGGGDPDPEPGDNDYSAVIASVSPLIPNDSTSSKKLADIYDAADGSTVDEIYFSVKGARQNVLRTRMDRQQQWGGFVSKVDELVRSFRYKTTSDLKLLYREVAKALRSKHGSNSYSAIIYAKPQQHCDTEYCPSSTYSPIR